MGLDGYAMIWSMSVERIDVRGLGHEVEPSTLAGFSWRQLPVRNAYNGMLAHGALWYPFSSGA